MSKTVEKNDKVERRKRKRKTRYNRDFVYFTDDGVIKNMSPQNSPLKPIKRRKLTTKRVVKPTKKKPKISNKKKKKSTKSEELIPKKVEIPPQPKKIVRKRKRKKRTHLYKLPYVEYSDLKFDRSLQRSGGTVSLMIIGNEKYVVKQNFYRIGELRRTINFYTKNLNKFPFIPSLVKISSIPKENRVLGNYALIYDYFNGRDLHKLIERKDDQIRNDVNKIIILRNAAVCIQQLHSKKIFHLDLKPHNIMVNSLNEIGLIDFDISPKLTATVKKNRNNPKKLGIKVTPQYSSPELFYKSAKEIKLDKVDVYSFAFICFSTMMMLEDPWESVIRGTAYGPNEFLLANVQFSKKPLFPKTFLNKNDFVKNTMKQLIENCWSDDINIRMNFTQMYFFCSYN